MNHAKLQFRWWRNTSLAGCVFLSSLGISPAWTQEKPAAPNPAVQPAPKPPAPVVQPLPPLPPLPNPPAPAPAADTLPAPTPVPPPEPPPFNPNEVWPPGTAEIMPIDLPTALRLADAGNPTIALARARSDEAYAAVRQAEVLWIPNLQANTQYLRHDGEIQNSVGDVFTTNKSSFTAIGGAIVDYDTGNILFAPLIARRLAAAQAANSQAVDNNIQLSVALAYIELLRSFAALAVNSDLLARDAEIMRRTQDATNLKLAASGAEINRAKADYNLRVEQRITMKGDIRVASSRLARLLLLEPTIALVPAERAVVPIALVPENVPADDLVGIGLLTRPELAESRALVDASRLRLRQSQVKPLMPHLQVYYYGGTFGGGIDSTMDMYNSRGDGGAGATWQLDNFGLGNLAANRVYGIQVQEANYHVSEVQAQVGDEVNSALQIVRARRELLDSAQAAVAQAAIEYDKFFELSIAMRGPRKELDTLRPLLSLQDLATARFQYLTAVVEYNRAQFQLYTAMGRPSMDALPKATATPVTVPTVPATPYQPPK